MAQAYSISVDISGIGQAVAGVRQLAQAVNSINAVRALGVGGGGRLAASAAQNPAASIRQQAQVLNAQASMMRAQLNLARASGRGQQPGFVSRLGTFARSTRFGQGGFMPLLGRGLDVLGAKDPRIAIAVMGIVTAVSISVTAIKAFVSAIRDGAERLTELTAARTVSGGTTAQIAALAATGLGSGDLVNAASLRQRLGSDPFAMMAGVGLGIGPQLGRPFGTQNEAALLQQAFDALRAMGEGEKQLRAARMLGLDALLPLINLSNEATKMRQADAAVQANILGKNGKSAREFSASLGRVFYNWQSVIQAFAGPALPQLTQMLNAFATVLRDMASWFTAHPQLGQQIAASIKGAIDQILILVDLLQLKNPNQGLYGSWQAYLKASGMNTAATQANTTAMQQNTQAWQSGTYGGGARAGSAIPPSLRGYALQRAIQGNSLRLGAITP